jgi:hypothetical protein
VSAPTPLLDFFRRGEVARDIRLLAAQGALAPRAHEQLGILMLLVEDADPEVRTTATQTLDRLPRAPLRTFLARTDVMSSVREFFAARGIEPAASSEPESDDPLVDDQEEIKDDVPEGATEDERRLSINQQLAKMNFTQRLTAACKGSREMRAILIRDPNKLICTTVLSSPKLTEQEVESFSRMANVAEDVLRIIGANRTWMKNYSIVLGLTKNPKTPLGLSLNMMARLNDRDLQMLSMDRNVPEPLRVAARKRVVAATSKK